MNLSDYDYTLPEELIAQEPAAERDRSRLLVLPPGDGPPEHREFRDIVEWLRPGDLLVLNDSRVFPARLIGEKDGTGGTAEVFLLARGADGVWDALARPAKRLREGTVVQFGDGLLRAVVVEKGGRGALRVRLESGLPEDEAIDAVGKTPLPPYIRRAPVDSDRGRYQTVYARERGSVAAPTAGLHFTGELLDGIRARGVQTAAVTLHVGIGTFRPLEDDDAEKDTLHREYAVVSEDTASKIAGCRNRGGRVIAVGTTTTRALESASLDGVTKAWSGWTELFIRPPFEFRAVDVLVTNFHLPRSSLLMLVAAFAGRERVLAAYREAVKRRYRFYSYGDAMLVFGR